MDGRSVAKFTAIVLLIGVLLYLAAFGATIGGFKWPATLDPANGIKRGLDIQGGSVITYRADGTNVNPENLVAAKNMLQVRLDNLGYTEATISIEGTDSLRVEIPSIQDPEEAVKKLGQTGELTFKDADGKVILNGNDVADARSAFGKVDDTGVQQNHVQLKFTDAGTTKFATETQRISSAENTAAQKNYIDIFMDENRVSRASVRQALNTATVIISGDNLKDIKNSESLAGVIRSGKLPFRLVESSLSSIGPTLGQSALSSSLFAGGIGVAFIILFMLGYYRLPGLIANIALLGYIGIFCNLLGWFHVNLTLPGIAGIILSIGMAVDANVIIFERIKEEIRSGKTLRSSVDSGFKRAFTAIIDSNITTLIAAVVLYSFGEGPIKGFAMTLFIGVIVSMFTAITLTHFLMKQVIGFNLTNKKLYGA